MVDVIVEGLLQGNRRMLGRAITLVESKKADHRAMADQILQKIMDYTGKSLRLGISGSPGVGKSTFIEAIGQELIAMGHRLAVLAVDPSSPINSGSILGDKTRMQFLSAHQNAFIRPSPAGTKLGGVANRTRESILLCEAAGYDTIIVETVGVGQSEYLVNSMVDTFIFLQQPNAGDQLQGIKKGILELAKIIAVNKADGKHLQAAQRAKTDLDFALNLIYQGQASVKPEVYLISSIEGVGIKELIQNLYRYVDTLKTQNLFEKQRRAQAVNWFEEELRERILNQIFSHKGFSKNYLQTQKRVLDHQISPRSAARELADQWSTKND